MEVRYVGVLLHTLYYYWDEECRLFISGCSLHRGTLYRGSFAYILLLLGSTISFVIPGSSLRGASSVISGFSSTHLTINGLKNIVRYTRGLDISGFYCSWVGGWINTWTELMAWIVYG